MKKIILNETQLKKIIETVADESSEYMFFSNLEQMRRQCDILLTKFDKGMIESTLNNGHDWAEDHIAVAKENLDQVFDFLMNEKESHNSMDEKESYSSMNESEEVQIDESKNKPNNPKLWASCLSWAKSRYKVCPSAYCNGAAAKRYKSKGGTWRKVKK